MLWDMHFYVAVSDQVNRQLDQGPFIDCMLHESVTLPFLSLCQDDSILFVDLSLKLFYIFLSTQCQLCIVNIDLTRGKSKVSTPSLPIHTLKHHRNKGRFY